MQRCAIIESESTRAACALLLVALLSLPSIGRCAEPDRATAKATKQPAEVAVTVVYDNYPFKEGLQTKWGFACVIEGLDETILFDTGGQGDLLLANMAKAGFRPEHIGSVVLSHAHGDHTGGLADFLKANDKVRVFVPKAFPGDFRQQVRRSGAEVVETEGPCQVCDGAWTTGVLTEPLAEQGLYLQGREGLVVVTGCAHPGIVRMAEAAHRHAERPVFAALGGFHLGRASDDQIDATIRGLRRLDVRRVAPTHCSGDKMRQASEQALGERYVRFGLGARFVFGGKQDDGHR